MLSRMHSRRSSWPFFKARPARNASAWADAGGATSIRRYASLLAGLDLSARLLRRLAYDFAFPNINLPALSIRIGNFRIDVNSSQFGD
jgi:hypothetical protein